MRVRKEGSGSDMYIHTCARVTKSRCRRAAECASTRCYGDWTRSCAHLKFFNGQQILFFTVIESGPLRAVHLSRPQWPERLVERASAVLSVTKYLMGIQYKLTGIQCGGVGTHVVLGCVPGCGSRS